MFTELMERNFVSHQNVTSDSSKNKEQRGGFYDLYKKKREEKLQGEATRKKVAKDDDKKANTATTKEPTAEPSEVNTTGEEELEISPTAWVVNKDPYEEEIVPFKESPIQLASPANVTSPVGYSHPHVRHSLSQMLLEDSNEADMDDWSSPSAFSEGDDDAEEPKGINYHQESLGIEDECIQCSCSISFLYFPLPFALLRVIFVLRIVPVMSQSHKSCKSPTYGKMNMTRRKSASDSTRGQAEYEVDRKEC
ncbi:hypothetical protein Tco_1482758 [Tanacetum coccineum]